LCEPVVVSKGHDLIPKKRAPNPEKACPKRAKAAFSLGRLLPARYSLRGEALITNPRFVAFSSEVVTGSREENASNKTFQNA